MNDAQQRGGTFGERLANAFADAFAQGYEHVIAVGSDCPRLHEVDWPTVAERLEEGTPVLGPTPGRDGAYLIGLSRAQFDREAFAALPWKSPAVFSALMHHLSGQPGTAPLLLEARDDVNTHEELLALVRHPSSRSGGLRARLRRVLGPAEHAAPCRAPTSPSRMRGPRSRAPPVPSSVG